MDFTQARDSKWQWHQLGHTQVWRGYLSVARCRLACVPSQLMSLPLTVSCFSKIQIGFTFLVPAHPGRVGKRAIKRVCLLGPKKWSRAISFFTARCYASAVLAMSLCQTTPHDSPGTLVFWCQISPRNSTGVTPYEGAECRWGRSKSATFDK